MIYAFDLDGTLIDSSHRHSMLLERLFSKYSVMPTQYSSEHFLEYKRNGNSTLNYLIKELGLSRTIAMRINEEWIAHIEDIDLIIECDKVYPETINILKRICDNNHKIFYISCRKSFEALMEEIQKIGIGKYADEVIVCDPCNGIKETIKALNRIKKENNDKVIIIGDSEIDYQAAIQTGSEYLILNRGFRSKCFWDERCVKSFSSLTQLAIVQHD